MHLEQQMQRFGVVDLVPRDGMELHAKILEGLKRIRSRDPVDQARQQGAREGRPRGGSGGNLRRALEGLARVAVGDLHSQFVVARLDRQPVGDQEGLEFLGFVEGRVGALLAVFQNRLSGRRGEPVADAHLQLRSGCIRLAQLRIVDQDAVVQPVLSGGVGEHHGIDVQGPVLIHQEQ